jgi:hypothetical protein
MDLSNSSIKRVVDSFSRVELGDPRRERRLRSVVSKLARAPSGSLPSALETDAEVQGAYRLANNRQVSFEALLESQKEQTRELAVQARNVLVLHDTTQATFAHLDPAEIGFLQTGKAGFFIHLGLVVDLAEWRRPLGIIHAETIHRKRRSKGFSRKSSGSETAKWKDRESARWQRGMLEASSSLESCERVVHVADREGDNYALLGSLVAEGARFVIRLSKQRRGRIPGESQDWSKVKEIASTADGLLEREVPLSRRKAKNTPRMTGAHPPRKGRLATLRFSATRVEIPRPRYLKDPVPESLVLNVVRVLEVNPLDGESPVEWLLYTTEPIDTVEQVVEIVDIYRTRWLLEEFNSALKTGTSYEARQFESKHALLNMLAMSLPIACEILWLRSRARTAPDAPATDVLTVRQLRVLDVLGNKKLPRNPTAQDALAAVAAMGGHLKRNGPAGWKVLMRGMSKLIDYETAWAAAEAVNIGSPDL